MDPLADTPISPEIQALPKADLHIHQEDLLRFAGVIGQRLGHPAYDPRSWIKQMMTEIPPGIERISGIYSHDNTLEFHSESLIEPENIIANMASVMVEAANYGAIYLELQFGVGSIAFNHPEFMHLFREAEHRVQAQYPRFYAEALAFLTVSQDEQSLIFQMQSCQQTAKAGLAGVHLRIDPYDREAPSWVWERAYEVARQLASAGLGIAIHVGEFSSDNIVAATRTPGARRLGHAVFAPTRPEILEAVATSGIAVECCLTCNVVLGGASSYETHPVRALYEAGIPVTLATDLPAHLRTTIGKEYALAARLGFSIPDLLNMTRNAIYASFTTPSRREKLLASLPGTA